MDSKQPAAAPQLLVWWVLWAAFLSGVCLQYFFLHRKDPPAPDDSMLWLAATIPLVVSLVIRWNMLPRVTAPTTALPLMIVAIALAESPVFFGIFVFPAHQWELFLAALLVIAQHAPVYASRLFSPTPEP